MLRSLHSVLRGRVNPLPSPLLSCRSLTTTHAALQLRPPQGPPGIKAPGPQKPIGLLDASGNPIRSAPKPAAPKPAAASAAASKKPAAAPQEGPIFEVDETNFQSVVLQSPVAVVLDCYADWCEPCKTLTPKLEAVVSGICGRGGAEVRLAKLNVDKVPTIAGQLGVRSLPTVIGIVGGKLVDSFQGVVPDEALKQFFGKLLTSAEQAGLLTSPANNPMHQLSNAISECNAMIEAGDHKGALETLPDLVATLQKLHSQVYSNLQAENAAKAKAENKEINAVRTDIGLLADVDILTARALAGLVRALLNQAQASGSGDDTSPLYEQARAYGELLRSRFKTNMKEPEVSRALAALDLAAGAETSLSTLQPLLTAVRAAPDDPDRRLELAEAQIGAGRTQQGVDNLLLILKKFGPGWKDGAAKTTLLKLFETLGAAHPIAVTGRKQLSKILFR